VLVRRLKEDLRKIRSGFPERKVEGIDLDGLPADQPELKLTEMLDEHRRTRDQRLGVAVVVPAPAHASPPANVETCWDAFVIVIRMALG
jgi:hypothetical protein